MFYASFLFFLKYQEYRISIFRICSILYFMLKNCFNEINDLQFLIIVQKLGIDRRYQIHLKSHTGEINVLLVNKDPMNNRPVVTPVPPPMTVNPATHNTTLTKETPQILHMAEQITTIAEKPLEKEKSAKRHVVPMETSTTGLWHCLFAFCCKVLNAHIHCSVLFQANSKIKNARCATRIHNKFLKTFSDGKIYFNTSFRPPVCSL